MKLIVAVIRPERLEAVQAALNERDVYLMTVSDVRGCGRQRGYTEVYRGTEFQVRLLPKLKLEIAVNDTFVEATIEAIVVERPEPTEEHPQNLSLDGGYQNPTGREAATEAKYIPHIHSSSEVVLPGDRKPGSKPRRWVVERTLAWLCKCRAILVRYDKKDENFLGLIQLACALCWYRRLHRLGRCDSKQGP